MDPKGILGHSFLEATLSETGPLDKEEMAMAMALRNHIDFGLGLHFSTGSMAHVTLGMFTIDHVILYKLKSLLICTTYIAELLIELSEL